MMCFALASARSTERSQAKFNAPAKAAVEGERQGELGADFGPGSPKRLVRLLLFSCQAKSTPQNSVPFPHRLTYYSQDLPTQPIRACIMITSCDRKPSLMSGSIDDLALINNSAPPAFRLAAILSNSR